MARLKNGEGVRNTLLPLTTVNMIYNSMMMAHNNDMTAAYCTDPVITIPAIQLESLVYSDSNVIELLPAMLPEIASGGTIGGTVGITTRNGGTVSSIEWSENSVTAKIKNSKDAKLKLSLAYDKITVNGSDVTDKVVSENGSSYYVIETDDEITVQYDISDIQDGSYTISSTSGNLTVNDTVEGSDVSYTQDVPDDARKVIWNAERITNNGFSFINTYTGKALTYNNGILIQTNYTGDNSQIWIVGDDGGMKNLNGDIIADVSLNTADETDIQTTIDSLSISATALN